MGVPCGEVPEVLRELVLMLRWVKGHNPHAEENLGRAVHPLGDRHVAPAEVGEESA